jgi:hypothetical protein
VREKLQAKDERSKIEDEIPGPSKPATRGRHAPALLSWARLLKRVFDIDIENCPNCGGALKIIAATSTRSGQASKIRR